MPKRWVPLALIGLGSNLGDRHAILNGAIAALGEAPGVIVRQVSSFHETEPVGGPPGQGMYLNAARRVETTLDPLALLHVLQEIEARFGRVRTVRWGERTLDLDLLLFDDRIIDDARVDGPASPNAYSAICPGAARRSCPGGRRPGHGPDVRGDSCRTERAGRADRIRPVADPCRVPRRAFIIRSRTMAATAAGLIRLAVLDSRWPKRTRKAKAAAKADDSGIKIVARNRRARHDYELMERVEAGMVLTGTEVKSLRNGKANLEDAYAEVDGSEIWLIGCDIPEYVQANRMNHVPKRPRKLLLHRREIAKLENKTSEKGITLVPLSIYFKKGMAKVELSLARGRKTFDKREALKKQDAKRDIDRAMRRR